MPATTLPTASQDQDDQYDLAVMSRIPPDIAARINGLFAQSAQVRQRDDAITNPEAYPVFQPPGDSLQPDGAFYPVRTDIHIAMTPGLARSSCALCRETKVSRWFRGLVFDEKTYCEPCHYKEAGSLTIQSAMALPRR